MGGLKDDFTDIVLSWSLEDIFNDDLYTNQVVKIPTSFESSQQYLGTFVYPLLEETRAELASKLETIHDAPFSNVISIDETRPIGTGAYRINIDYWRNKVINHGKDTYKTLPGDIVIISSAKPEHASDLQRSGWKWTFASVKNLSTDYKKVKAKKASKERDEIADEPVEFIIQILKGSETEILELPLYVVYLTNITTNKRIWSSLQMDTGSAFIQQTLLSSPADGEIFNCDACSSDNLSWWEDIDPSLIANLNDSQMKLIFSCLQKMKCHHKCSVQLIWGPPGTGKTNTPSVLLFILLQMNFRTIVCAPTNIAITEVASRVLSLVRQSFKSEKLHQFPSLAHLVVFGNEERLKVGGGGGEDIEDIYLDYRVERLYECFGDLKGWKNSICCMLDFFKNPIPVLHLFEDNELMREKGFGSSCIQLIQERFNYAASLIKTSISTVLTHFPASLIPEQNVNDMVQMFSIIDSIDTCLQNDLFSEKVEEILLHGDKSGETPDVFQISSSLLLMRNKCLLLLRNLLCAFDEQHTQCKEKLENLCFENGRLIFCTASTSYKLNSKDVAPLELLVIDEASQLKECESTIPLQLLGIRHATLVGDNCQLPALVNSKVSADAEFGRSLFERLPLIGYSKQLLDIQYRMHPSISRFPNSTFYFNKIIDAPNAKIIDIKELDDVSHSRRNYVEVAIAVKLVQNLYRAWKATKEKLSIGVISPYSAQVAAIQKNLSPKFPEGFSVEVKSVDGFQGGEKDVIILSTVRSNGHCSIGFLSNFQRTNVSLTRARHCLWILGHERTLRESQSVWSSLIQDAKDRGCFFEAHQDESIKKSVLEVKKELDQLDDLLKEDSVLFSCTRWKVVFSDNFRKSFSQLKASSLRKAILNVMFKLANGWRPQRSSVDYVSETSNQIVKQFLVEGKYIICTIDIEKEDKYIQLLKVWDVMALEEVPKFLKRLDNIFRMYTDDYISYCKQTCFEGKLEVPMSWDSGHDIIPFKASSMDEDDGIATVDIPGADPVVENSTISESLLLMKFYSLSPNTASYLLSELSETEIDLPFEVTNEEREVIRFNKSSFILGRSGTGKTTILTMKLFQKEQLYHAVSQGFDSASSSSLALWPSHLADNLKDSKKTILRQVFVTVSPKLCRAVKKHITDLVRFTHGEICSPETISSELDCLDETVLLGDIPDSFTNIPAEKYPLVITFHKFLMMLDASIGVSYFSRFCSIEELSVNSFSLQSLLRTKEVNFERFCSLYWPHFNNILMKSLDPARVFTEIMSYIKGSSVGAGEKFILNREDYILLSDKRTSTLSSKMREDIYDIFLGYERMKLRNREYDLADVVIDLHHRFEKDELQTPNMDFVYIDEVQDLTMSQISLFKHVCSNVDEGFVFSGDTAQTIARGIDFRFEDIRSLFYNEFLMGSRSEPARRTDKDYISDTFNLSRNFRTHTGVLLLAQSVINLLYHFFPQSIDILKPETSLIFGEPPVFLEPCSDENAILSIFGDVKGSGSAMIGFGAEQVILVRDDNAKEEVCGCIGNKALVLTILECKGLEFQDVLLYNFFGSSPLRHQWRVVYELMKQENLLDSTFEKSYPSFNHARHSLMCSELKQLYVAITRTRQRLWISENTEEFSTPILDYWKKLGLVQLRVVDSSLVKAMQVASTVQEWQTRAVKLLWEENYEMAMLCFERAGDELGGKMAKAAALKARARRLQDSKQDERQLILREAGELYNSIGKTDQAAECYIDIGDFQRAGTFINWRLRLYSLK